MRPIDADTFSEQYGSYYAEQGPENGFIGTVGELIAKYPTIEAEPVRRGQWNHLRTAGVISVWKCSECDSTIKVNSSNTNPSNHDKFCYNCGAKMDGGSENGLN